MTVANLVARKRHEDVLRALADARLADVRWAVIGDGPERERLEQLAAELGIAGRVEWHGQLEHEDAVQLMFKLMKERGITHTTSECTLRGFTCAQANVDPKYATPAEIARMRALAVGHQVEGITGGLAVKEQK